MFSKALFKQSCKANGMMWAIVTAVTCFILAVVVLICGSGNITETKNAIQDTIVKQEIAAEYSNRATRGGLGLQHVGSRVSYDRNRRKF